MTNTGPQSAIVVGAGFGGLGMAVSLLRAGVRDVRILERGDDVGGCWRDNTYPGAACDVPSYLYSFSFAPNPHWTRRFARQPEILAYLQDCAEKFGLTDRITLRAEVSAASYDDDAHRWTVHCADGSTRHADLLVFACGQLSQPSIPSLPGVESFRGNVFHSAQWDHDFSPAGRRVAVIGTGASAIQFVPHLVTEAEKVVLFQRSAPHIIPKTDYPYPTAVRRLFSRAPALQRIPRWFTYAILEPRGVGFTRYPALLQAVRWVSDQHRAAQVPDPQLRAALTPDHPVGCKRVLISNDYLPAVSAPNVEVVTSTIAEVSASAIRTDDGTVHDVDTIIYGTGFAATGFLHGISVTGRAGATLADTWSDGARAHLGLTVPGFPNMFLLYGPNTNLGHNSIILMLEAQMRRVVEMVQALRRTGAAAVEVRPQVQQRFVEEMETALAETVWSQGCRSWYLDSQGRNTTNWPRSTTAYIGRMRRFDEADYRWESPAAASGAAAGHSTR
ncbi:NAD(P)/FAD-dependent oxidoreductase [Williamsia sp. CHRR-6]|uniref:flavin-containing monooxygenase n=1 Tax=Williamsia sp. CHRR-6 TaxID=2835871 RepID=UPI001BD984D9|nr:NAD(P)/FAD-dependent oxidoreductase [Williamsia sp. CHRR-6]MBT0567243.1 NAD(P)/FAD-dependent oxidoreductase [Williamsia sp. CHRR-6]